MARERLEEMNEAIVHAVEEHALTPAAVQQIIHVIEPVDLSKRCGTLERDRKEIKQRISRLVAAMELVVMP